MNSLSSTSPSVRAFTLLELLGTMAILGLLSWVATEGVLARLKESLRQDESARLAELADALRRGVVRQRAIPAETNWAAFVARELGAPESRSRQNAAGWNRRLIFDPAFRVGSPPAFPPFTQSSAGSLPPVNARAVLLSTVAADFPSLAAVSFDDLWNCPPGRLPAHWSSRWAGQPADLCLERIAFHPLFRAVRLNNLDLDAPARFGLGSTNSVITLTGGAFVETFYLGESWLLLIDSGGEIQQTVPVMEQISFAYEGGRWRPGLSSGVVSGQASVGGAFDQLASAPLTPWGAAPGHVARAMHEFLADYCAWAESGFLQTSGVEGHAAPGFRRVVDAASRLEDFSGLLLGKSPPPTP